MVSVDVTMPSTCGPMTSPPSSSPMMAGSRTRVATIGPTTSAAPTAKNSHAGPSGSVQVDHGVTSMVGTSSGSTSKRS